MPLPLRWVDELFAKLSVSYGDAFPRQYDGMDLALVKANWAEVLDGFKGASIAYGLRNLPQRPPNAMQFRDLCRNAPDTTPRLPPPNPGPMTEERRALLADVKALRPGAGSDPLDWARKLQARHQAGEKLTLGQLQSLRAVAHKLGAA